MYDLVKAYISRAALRHNAELLRGKTRKTPLCAVVKANAYGHDVSIVTQALAGLGISFWGVATLPEAVEMKQLGVQGPILVFRPIGAYESGKAIQEQIDLMLELAVRATVVNQEGLHLLAKRACHRRKLAYVHIKIDTGMGRNGCPAEDGINLVLRAQEMPELRVEGLYSHFASADEKNLDFARQQLAMFKSMIKQLASRGVRLPICHMANSGAIFNLSESWLDMIRPGRALYGFGGKFIRGSDRLRPALRLEAPVLMTKWIKKGNACGYGCTFVARRDTRIGLLPIGYADGYSRRWSNTGLVDINGKIAPVIGRVSMDLTIIDLTDIRSVDTGSQAYLISNRRKDPHSVESMAEQLETIPHEITSVLGRRIQRVMVA